MLAMGFGGEDAAKALAAADGNPERAVEFLLSGHIPEPAPQDAEPQSAEQKGAHWLKFLRAGLQLLDVEAPKPDFDDFEFEAEETSRGARFVARLRPEMRPLLIWPNFARLCTGQQSHPDGRPTHTVLPGEVFEIIEVRDVPPANTAHDDGGRVRGGCGKSDGEASVPH